MNRHMKMIVKTKVSYVNRMGRIVQQSFQLDTGKERDGVGTIAKLKRALDELHAKDPMRPPMHVGWHIDHVMSVAEVVAQVDQDREA